MEQQETEVILLLETLHIVAILMNTEQLAIQEVCVYISNAHTHTHLTHTHKHTLVYTQTYTYTQLKCSSCVCL